MVDKHRIAAPLCSTCAYHEAAIGRTNVMWGAGKVLLVIIGIIITILVAGQRDNSKKISNNTDRIIKHELDMNDGIHRIERVMAVMSINQKRHMEEDGVKYVDPAPIKGFSYDEVD